MLYAPNKRGLKPVTHELSTSISALFTAGDIIDRMEQIAIAFGAREYI